MPQENRMFAEMLRPARQWLAERDPQDISRRAQVPFNGASFRIPYLKRSLHISWPELVFEGEEEGWLQLACLHYLHCADGAPLSGRPISFGMLKGGMARGGGFDRTSEARLSRLLTDASEEKLRCACALLGGRELPSNADLCMEFAFFPRYPLTLKIWFADEEFPASGRLFLDAAADHYLTLEDAVSVGELFLNMLEEAL